jgi:rubrerythrin
MSGDSLIFYFSVTIWVISTKEGSNLKNVVVSKIVQYVFTEDQLRGKWREQNKKRPFEDLSDLELMALAKRILEAASHSELEEFTVGSPWRTKADAEGKMVAEDDSDPAMHIEVIDTEKTAEEPKVIAIDRLYRLRCMACGLVFFLEDSDRDLTTLKCPACGGHVHAKRD